MPEYLYEYHHKGQRWSFSIWAEDRADAQERINKLPLAKYSGELYMRVPAQLGWFARLWCFVANFFRENR